MDQEFKFEAKGLVYHLKNLAQDFEKDGMEMTARDLRQASLTIKVLVHMVEAAERRQVL